MRKLLFVFAGASLLLAVLAPVAIGDGNNKFEARLNGYLETPSISTPGRGSFHLRIKGPEIKFTLSYQDIPVGPTVAHIHFGRPDVAGGVSVFLCGGGGEAACPTSGTITGTIVSGDVVGPGAQGIAPGEYAELVRAIRHGATYVNVHSDAYKLGEIRGNIHRD